MKMMQGAFCLACSNRSRTREAPTPTNISTKSEPEIEKNGTPASPATARASSVLPVPGGPYSSTPFGMRAPSAWNFLGFSRNSLISCNSSTASSAPATSLNVILGESTAMRLARLLPKLMTFEPPPCIWLMRKIQRPRKSTNGRAPKQQAQPLVAAHAGELDRLGGHLLALDERVDELVGGVTGARVARGELGAVGEHPGDLDVALIELDRLDGLGIRVGGRDERAPAGLLRRCAGAAEMEHALCHVDEHEHDQDRKGDGLERPVQLQSSRRLAPAHGREL